MQIYLLYYTPFWAKSQGIKINIKIMVIYKYVYIDCHSPI